MTAAVPQKAALSTGAGPDRHDGTYRGRMCTQDSVDTSEQRCWSMTLTVKQGTVSGSWMVVALGKRAYLKGTIAPEGAVKIALEDFNRKGSPVAGAMTGAWSDDTISISGTWHHNGAQVKATWKREP